MKFELGAESDLPAVDTYTIHVLTYYLLYVFLGQLKTQDIASLHLSFTMPALILRLPGTSDGSPNGGPSA